MVDIDYEKLLTDYPFLTYLIYGNNEYIGIIQNVDDIVTTIYDYGALKSVEEKQIFLKLADTWWWESNRLIPINVFLKAEWQPFRVVVKTMNSKGVEIKFGPQISLNSISAKRTKRRSITLVRKLS
jgi:hypothetical protein|tara:strand:+ start:435 stop:812 length:378 start_codon:yes stop_codon:yes gene_type:complete